MKKLIFAILIVALLVVSFVPTMAATEPFDPVIFHETFTVTSAGGSFQVGFVKMDFPKNFMGRDMSPITFDASVFVSGGLGTLEVSPDVAAFIKNVRIKVGHYNGLLYDETSEQNVSVRYRPQTIIASHFSRYCWH